MAHGDGRSAARKFFVEPRAGECCAAATGPRLTYSERWPQAEIVEGPSASPSRAMDLGLVAPDEGDLRAKADSALNRRFAAAQAAGTPTSRSGAPDHVAYPGFLYDLARQAREADPSRSAGEADGGRP